MKDPCKDDAGCLAWINQLTDASEKKEAQHYRMHGLARIRPQEALKEMESLATDPLDPPSYCVGKEWVLANPQAAADWAKSLPEGSAKERALEIYGREITPAVRDGFAYHTAGEGNVRHGLVS